MASLLETTIASLRSFADGRTFRTIYADPPWQFQNRTGKVAPEHRRLTRYPTMTISDIKALPVYELASICSHLYLWVPNALLPDGLEVMRSWGFEYKTNIIWEKVRHDGQPDGRGVGFYFRNVTDHDVRVGVYTLAPGRGVSVGTMHLSRADGPGIYYNVEAYMTHRMGGFGSVGRTMSLTQAQLDAVNGVILFSNSWSTSNNCCAFATRVWNTVAPDHIGYHMLPVVVKGRIGSGGCPGMDDPSRNDVYRMHGIGWGASLSRVNNRSLVMYIG